jgi:hypothetical protein
MLRKSFSFFLLIMIVAVLASCGETDVVAEAAKRSFAELAKLLPSTPRFDNVRDAWVVESPKGDLFFLADSASRNPDAILSIDVAPFVAAGLDPSRLRGSGPVLFAVESGRLEIRGEIGDEAPRGSRSSDMVARFASFADSFPGAIGYHAQLDHYGVAVGGGFMFEWAGDLAANDKDLVFVLDPGALIAAGVDPKRVEGWIHAEVEVMDSAGRKSLVYKFLRPFDLN